MFHLAYLGVMFDQSSPDQVGAKISENIIKLCFFRRLAIAGGTQWPNGEGWSTLVTTWEAWPL